ncbi:MAG TPA: hypothetical protein DCR26_01725 [Porphyromonadaceae bacterium]|jgi:hypothetical protein|nr:SIMPL domain-containing protein [Muribaculaceae bacterium Isolate-013 (NCI)]HAP28813.1 hypothetical protein [Porphyromonadaceae bacterium]
MDLKKLTSVAGAFLVGAGIFFSGLFIKSGIDNIAYRDRTVSVRGLAERTVESDYVTWPIQYRVAGNDLISLYDQVTANNAIIVKFLTSNGIAKEDISVNPPDTYNATANQYGSDNFQYKYALDCNVTVATTNVKKVRELLNRQSELLREGIPYSNSYINYEYRALNDIKPQMIADATKAAREAAQKFALDSDSKIGKMKSATQGQFSIDDLSSSTPYLKKVRVVSNVVYYLND